jgi:hypothetical protein
MKTDDYAILCANNEELELDSCRPSVSDSITLDMTKFPQEDAKPSLRFIQKQTFGVIVAGIYFLTACCIITVIMNLVNDRVPINLPPLPDFGHEWLPHLRPESLNDIIFGSLVVSWILFMILIAEREEIPHILMKWLLCHGTLFLFRILTISLTSLPVTQNHCREHYIKIINVAWNSFLGMISLGALSQHCGDLLFSGHSIVITLIWLVFRDHCKFCQTGVVYDSVVIFVRILVYSWAFCAYVAIIATRNHYTVDVIIGIYLTVTTYKLIPDRWPFYPFNKYL